MNDDIAGSATYTLKPNNNLLSGVVTTELHTFYTDFMYVSHMLNGTFFLRCLHPVPIVKLYQI